LDDADHVKRTLEVNRSGMKYLEVELRKLGLEFVPSSANFILVRVPNGQEAFKRLLSEGVIVRPMGGYDFPEYVRVTVGTMEENRRFIDALRKIIPPHPSLSPATGERTKERMER
jgi:histidinol-phosphate aminotransferase